MKITPSLKAKLASIAWSIIFGGTNDLRALATTLRTLADETEAQADAQSQV